MSSKEQAPVADESRTIASMRLARLQIDAGLAEESDDLSLGQKIAQALTRTGDPLGWVGDGLVWLSLLLGAYLGAHAYALFSLYALIAPAALSGGQRRRWRRPNEYSFTGAANRVEGLAAGSACPGALRRTMMFAPLRVKEIEA